MSSATRSVARASTQHRLVAGFLVISAKHGPPRGPPCRQRRFLRKRSAAGISHCRIAGPAQSPSATVLRHRAMDRTYCVSENLRKEDIAVIVHLDTGGHSKASLA